VYFTTISMGIIGGVNIKLLWVFIGIIITFLISFIFISWITEKFFKRELFHISFSEGNKIPSLSISSPKYMEFISNSPYVISINKSKDSYHYILQSKNSQKLIEITCELDQLKDVSYELAK